MFTGIVEELGRLESLDGGRLRIAATDVLDDVAIGESIAVNGCCLTVVAFGDDWWEADVSDETISRTSLAGVAAGRRNQPRTGREGVRPPRRSHRAGSRRRRRRGGRAGARPPREGAAGMTRYLVEKGSVTVDGVSLTVVDALDDGFTVAIIPHTADVTTLGAKRPGDLVNLEVDVMAKYVEKLMSAYTDPAHHPREPPSEEQRQ